MRPLQMVLVCFPGNALSKDLINLPTLVFKKRVFWFGAGACALAVCFAIE